MFEPYTRHHALCSRRPRLRPFATIAFHGFLRETANLARPQRKRLPAAPSSSRSKTPWRCTKAGNSHPKSSRRCPRCHGKTLHSDQPMNLHTGFPQIPYNQLSKSGNPSLHDVADGTCLFLHRVEAAATTRFSNTCHLSTKCGLISSQFFGGSSFSIFNTSGATRGKKW